MTLAIPTVEATPTEVRREQRRATLLQPGLLEQTLVLVATFVFLHSTPNVWFRTRAEAALDDGSNPLVVVLTLALVAIAFVRVAGSIDYLIALVRLDSAVYLFAGLTLASTFWSVDPLQTAKTGIIFVAVTLYGSYLILRFSLDRILRLLATMFALSTLLNMVFIVGLPQYGIDNADNLTGVFGQKNALGYTAALAIPTLLIAGKTFPRTRIIFFPAALVQVGLLLGSQSKTMLLATIVPTGLIPVYQLFRSKKTLRGAVISSLFASSAFAVAFATANIAVLAQWLDKDVSLTGRVPMWQGLIPVALERPLLGHGAGAAFGGFFSPVHEVLIQNQWNPTHAHNALLHLWLETGIVGALLFLIIYVRAVSRAIKIVAIVPGAVGLWPLVFLTTALMVSITESGVNSEKLGWAMLVVAILSVSMHLNHRSRIGLSNDLRQATLANAQRKWSQPPQ